MGFNGKHLSLEEAKQRIANGEKYVVRQTIPSTVGTPNTKGSLMLNNDEGIASFPRDLNLLFLQTKFKLNSIAR